jgi:hypothetical protein
LIYPRWKGDTSSEGITVFNVMSDIEIGIEDILDVDKDIGSDLEYVLVQHDPFASLV